LKIFLINIGSDLRVSSYGESSTGGIESTAISFRIVAVEGGTGTGRLLKTSVDEVEFSESAAYTFGEMKILDFN